MAFFIKNFMNILIKNNTIVKIIDIINPSNIPFISIKVIDAKREMLNTANVVQR